MAADMNNDYGGGGGWTGMIITFVLLFISTVTLSQVAVICTALAGLSTTAFTIYKWYHFKKNKNKDNGD